MQLRESHHQTRAQKTKKLSKGKIPITNNTKKVLFETEEATQVKTFPCSECGFIYNSLTDLNRHMKGMHAKLKEQLFKPHSRRRKGS